MDQDKYSSRGRVKDQRSRPEGVNERKLKFLRETWAISQTESKPPLF
jgi:hypothetical protein